MCRSVFFLFLFAVLISSCQKEIDGTITFPGGVDPATLKPKVGTTWTYRMYTYHQDGTLYQTLSMTHRAKNEETLGGEKWLNIIDVDADTTVYYLQVKADGLYQYANNAPQLFLKDPAQVGDNYNTYNTGVSEQFFVRRVKDTLPTGIGDVLANYYEGYRYNPYLIRDEIWYNKNAWVLRRTEYQTRNTRFFFWYKYRVFYLDNIVY